MEPRKVGQTLGIGMRVASRLVQQRMAQQASSPAPPQVTQKKPLTDRATAVRKGGKAFWHAFLGPFTHAGSILWLEITGLFFALFMCIFLQNVYRVRGSWRAGPDHAHLLLYVALAMGFAWFSASSFLRARRKSRRGR